MRSQWPTFLLSFPSVTLSKAHNYHTGIRGGPGWTRLPSALFHWGHHISAEGLQLIIFSIFYVHIVQTKSIFLVGHHQKARIFCFFLLLNYKSFFFLPVKGFSCPTCCLCIKDEVQCNPSLTCYFFPRIFLGLNVKLSIHSFWLHYHSYIFLDIYMCLLCFFGSLLFCSSV